MHDPVSALAMRCTARVKDERLLHSNAACAIPDRPIFTRGLPVPTGGAPIGPGPVGVLAIKGTKEVPLHVAALEAGQRREIPWLVFVYIDLGDSIDGDFAAEDVALQVVAHKLLISRMETEPRRKSR